MKLALVSVACMLAATVTLVAQEPKEPKAKVASLYAVGISGMDDKVASTQKVRQALASVPGVGDVRVNFERAVAHLTLKDGAEQLRQETVAQALEKSGFAVTSFVERKLTAYAVGVSGMQDKAESTKKIQDALSALDGVHKVDVDFDHQSVRILGIEGSLTREVVAKALKDGGGFEVTDFEEQKRDADKGKDDRGGKKD